MQKEENESWKSLHVMALMCVLWRKVNGLRSTSFTVDYYQPNKVANSHNVKNSKQPFAI